MAAPAENNFLDKAIQFLEQAIEEDDKRNYSEAHQQYMNAIDYLMAAQRSENNEKSKLLIQAKADEYLDRAETIKQYFRKQQHATSTTEGELGEDVANGISSAFSSTTAQSIILDKAFESAKRAIDEDTKQNYAEAYNQYMKAMDEFMFAQRYETNEKSKSLIRMEIEEYLSRTETIKKHMKALEIASSAGRMSGNLSKPPRPPQTIFLDRAIAVSQQAITQDTKENYPEAYQLYNNALNYFMLAQKYEKNEESKVAIRANMEEHLTRAEALKKRFQS